LYVIRSAFNDDDAYRALDTAERLLNAIDQAPDRGVVGDIGFEHSATTPETANCSGYGLRFGGPAAVVHRHVDTGLGQRERDRLADSARSACNQSDAARKIGSGRHRWLLLNDGRTGPLSRKSELMKR